MVSSEKLCALSARMKESSVSPKGVDSDTFVLGDILGVNVTPEGRLMERQNVRRARGQPVCGLVRPVDGSTARSR